MNRSIRPMRDFLHRESSGGILILIASALGLIIANSPISETYFSFLEMQFSLGNDSIYLKLTMLKVINYIFMTLFFFVVGLEIKRELTSGHLSSFKKAVMPFVAALGGMAVPAMIYLLIAGREAPGGWGVAVATDIALAVGLLAIIGSHAVASLRTFLLALAVIDDIGAILVIAFVYSTGIVPGWIAGALLTVVFIVALKKLQINQIFVYVPLGALLWYCMYRGGIHPTLAGVVLGMMTPNIARKDTNLIDAEDSVVSIIEWLENKLHPYSSFLIVPLFAFANTGVEISQRSITAAINSPIAWGIFFGLVVGKPVGIVLSSWGAKKVGLGEYPEGANTLKILATGSAAGIGFTVAIFIANLAFDERAIQELAIFAVIIASLVSGAISTILFKIFARQSA
ncbi:MAG: Na+/H+ antiporter NhaA [Actinobacteria bacterium]|nr:Na+/H+ antiporter NhaA [Actinomycetota bacterium]